ncbi:hypothetical protein scyTo_0005231 [Scyliorhinus torazame]|uniref:Uncharacterized protein n=1 Tax=Scyliorhinus torazame TaxID=75743 RepID=A0A401P4B1_SCYTO|nr:hypothetical protein [Scyliorhinus torazame]
MTEGSRVDLDQEGVIEEESPLPLRIHGFFCLGCLDFYHLNKDPIIYKKQAQECSAMKSALGNEDRAVSLTPSLQATKQVRV